MWKRAMLLLWWEIRSWPSLLKATTVHDWRSSTIHTTQYWLSEWALWPCGQGDSEGWGMIWAPVSSKGYCLRIKYISGCTYSVAVMHVSILSVHVPIFKCSACWTCTCFSSFLVSESTSLFKRLNGLVMGEEWNEVVFPLLINSYSSL